MSSEPDDPRIEQAFARMQRDLPRVAPGADMFEQIAAGLPPRTPVTAPARARGRLGRPTLALPAGAALIALVAALVIALVVSGNPPATVSAALVPHGGSAVHGRVQLYDPGTRNGRLVVHLQGLGVAPAGEHYTVWVLRRGVSEMTPVASLSSGADVRLDLPLPEPGRYAALDISLQRNDASPVHSTVSVGGATLG
jgi:hypothetical protein